MPTRLDPTALGLMQALKGSLDPDLAMELAEMIQDRFNDGVEHLAGFAALTVALAVLIDENAPAGDAAGIMGTACCLLLLDRLSVNPETKQ